MAFLRAFIVEDSPIIRENLVATLEELVPVQVIGYAEDEAAALRWLRDPTQPVDLVIVDVVLKQGSGLGVLQGLRESRLTVKVVVLSNYISPDIRNRCAALGADRVFDKSGEIDALIAYCERLAAGDDTVSGGLPSA